MKCQRILSLPSGRLRDTVLQVYSNVAGNQAYDFSGVGEGRGIGLALALCCP